MLIDTHCHINLMVKKTFDQLLTAETIEQAQKIIHEAYENQVTTIINVGTSLIESQNCIALSAAYESVFATIGIHPNDINQATIKDDLKKLRSFATSKNQHKIVGIGECGIDLHYPDHNLIMQQDIFKVQIELALEYNLALVVHSRDACDETLTILQAYRPELQRVVMHCYSYDESVAQDIISMGFMLGMGGTVTYPKNNSLRTIATTMPLEYMVLETDAPYLPIQSMRGKENHPQYIRSIAEYIAQLRTVSWQEIAQQTTINAKKLFGLS